MEHLTKLLRDSYNLQESKPDKSAYWHLQQLRSEIKQLAIPCCTGLKDKEEMTFDEWLKVNKYTKTSEANYIDTQELWFTEKQLLKMYNDIL
jgi:hypothetical protein